MTRLREARTRPWLIHSLILHELQPTEDGARLDWGLRLVQIGTRTDPMRTGTAEGAIERFTANLSLLPRPHEAKLALGLPLKGDVLLLTRAGSACDRLRWPLDGPPARESDGGALRARVDAEGKLPAARGRLLRLLSDHGRRDPRGVPSSRRIALCERAARDMAEAGDTATFEALRQALTAEQLTPTNPARAASSAMARLLGDL